jgi:hypothetical protein
MLRWKDNPDFDIIGGKMSSKVDKQRQRILNILKGQDEDEIFVSEENLRTFLEYLKENLEFPCLVTGIEDFPWEERFVFGYGDKKEYEKLKKTNPSYSDRFTLLEFEDFVPGEEQIFVKVERVKDKNRFSLPLDTLEAVGRKSKNYQLLDDYACWWVNYQ